jgi:hypothetical protein
MTQTLLKAILFGFAVQLLVNRSFWVMDETNRQPSLEETVAAVTDAQLHRYNAATLALMDESVQRWARDLSALGAPVKPHFVQVRFQDVKQPELLRFFNAVPTSFSLSDEQVDKLIAAGRESLRGNPDYQRFLADMGGARVAARYGPRPYPAIEGVVPGAKRTLRRHRQFLCRRRHCRRRFRW